MIVQQIFLYNLVDLNKLFLINIYIAPFEEKSAKHHLKKV